MVKYEFSSPNSNTLAFEHSAKSPSAVVRIGKETVELNAKQLRILALEDQRPQ